MFTGIIAHLGKAVSIKSSIFTFQAPFSFCKNLEEGTSVSVNGVCLTVFKKPSKNTFSFELMPETIKKTMLENLKEEDLVNLELPATPQSFLSGHIVLGHIDTAGQIKAIAKEKESGLLKINIPSKFSKYIVEKGSIAVNGVSLTIIDAGKDFFIVGIIPYTWENTMFNKLKIGDYVNIEVDVIGKYVEKLVGR
ncbi:MAG: riboflavin synthase [Candidatus Levybacteria bacterium]|nr:riboflavin synthase [Candidatus Levybacteria bacterium]